MQPRLKTRLWIQAQIRQCDIDLIPIVIARQGDPDAGSVLVRLLRAEGRTLLLRRFTLPDGNLGWMPVGGKGEIDGATADAHIAREVGRDPDLWVVEIDDARGRYRLDGPLKG